MTRARTLRLLAAFAMLAVIVGGCSNAPAGAGGRGSDGATSTRTKAVKFSECMRDNGVGDFPDPDASGSFAIETIANGSVVDTSSVAFTRALSACKDLEPAGFYGEARSPQQQEAALEFAQCIRDHGVKDFPDPAIDDPLVDTNRIGATGATSYADERDGRRGARAGDRDDRRAPSSDGLVGRSFVR